ncbi:hypothetical protein SAMN04489761_3478 [Tenacibaculum sp. MAR_2009_124]|uniref:hypothetical protein n=1 Tax=Tenacibaculum sp. MAR_2009_124 TaxID=1250059 RepID=UPI000895A5BA|nr:hypothetical protein [Tenacibaculum sp. MAR_2009_124]SEC67854.1 hypothetical protein SAMN04489761_3478 [Tenacibaculum sp. MAR_2009_124]
METLESILPRKLKPGQLFEVNIPFEQLPIQTLIFVVRGRKNNLILINNHNYQLQKVQKKYLTHLRLLQQTNSRVPIINRAYLTEEQVAYIKLVFSKFDELNTLN